MKKKLWTGLAVGVMMLGMVGVANASLISQDLAAPGDNHLTYDSGTGLTWLDVTNTYRVSPNDVLAGFGGYTTNLGFRYATEGEFLQLLTDANITPGHSTTWNIPNINNTRSLINLLGITYSDGHTFLSNGILAESTPGNHMAGALAVNDIGEYDAWTGSLSPLAGYFNSTGYGSFLVKDPTHSAPVPEPATMLLFSTGLAGLVGTRIKRKKI